MHVMHLISMHLDPMHLNPKHLITMHLITVQQTQVSSRKESLNQISLTHGFGFKGNILPLCHRSNKRNGELYIMMKAGLKEPSR